MYWWISGSVTKDCIRKLSDYRAGRNNKNYIPVAFSTTVVLQKKNWKIIKIIDDVEQSIVICQWRADPLFAEAEN